MKKLLTVVKLNPMVQEFAKQHFEILTEKDLTADNAKEIEVIMSSGVGIVNRALLDKLPNVKMIDNFGVGFDGCDIEAIKERNIALCVTSSVLTDDVADLALSLLLNVSRQVTLCNNFVNKGLWAQGQKVNLGTKASCKNVGIIGLGKIGQAIAKRCLGFDMTVSYYDKYAKNDAYKRYDSLEELAHNVDYLIVSCAATPDNRNLINKEILEALGPSGFLINVARGSLVDEEALSFAIENKVIKGAALDVFAHEPNVPQGLLNKDNVVLTPHIASATVETRKAMADIVIANLKAFMEGKEYPTALKL